ncbi:MAG: hypothetical protein II425_04675, partial [Oscillospiraceae bacterium]|nr:hypothetical protein [Oscillospiraceae bacterium]
LFQQKRGLASNGVVFCIVGERSYSVNKVGIAFAPARRLILLPQIGEHSANVLRLLRGESVVDSAEPVLCGKLLN